MVAFRNNLLICIFTILSLTTHEISNTFSVVRQFNLCAKLLPLLRRLEKAGDVRLILEKEFGISKLVEAA